jgi:hypothetical protein
MADGLTLPKIGPKGPVQWTRLFKEVIPFKVTFEDDSIATNTIYVGAGTVAVTGANLGDFVLCAVEGDVVDKHFVGYVTAADVVTVMLSNNNGSTDTDFATGYVVNGMVLVLNDAVWNQSDWV